jgi:tetraacyldisaccharide 4'-kinase
MGGAGKTPVARALRELLAESGVEAHVLSRGHGGRQRGPLRVDRRHHTHEDVGDEPLLHAGDGPAWVSRDRVAGARAAIQAGAQALILDDGFQSPALAKDLSILVFDAEEGLGNGCVVPAGPLREPVEAGLRRADLVAVMHEGPRMAARPSWLASFQGPVVACRLQPSEPPPPGPLLAFAGIGRPQNFFKTLACAGGDVVDGAPFPDHHVFTPGDDALLDDLAQAHGAQLITTEKDFARLSLVRRQKVACFPVKARFADDAPLRAALAAIIARARASS